MILKQDENLQLRALKADVSNIFLMFKPYVKDDIYR